MTIPTPTSNWSDRGPKGRDFGRATPAEPTSFASDETDGAQPFPRQTATTLDETPATSGSTGPRGGDIWDAPLTTSADTQDSSHDDLLNAPLTSSTNLREDRRDDLLEAPLTSSIVEGSSDDDHLLDAPLASKVSETRLEGERPEKMGRSPMMATPLAATPSMAPAPAGEASRPVPERWESPVAERRSATSGKWAWAAIPVGVAAVAGVGYLVLGGGGAEPTAPEPPAGERPAMAEPAAPQALTGMGVSDLGAGSVPLTRTTDAEVPAPPLARAPQPGPIQARESVRESSASAARTSEAPPAAPVQAEAVPSEPAPPLIETEPLIATEPLAFD